MTQWINTIKQIGELKLSKSITLDIEKKEVIFIEKRTFSENDLPTKVGYDIGVHSNTRFHLLLP